MTKKSQVSNFLSVIIFLAVLVVIFFSACYMFKAQCGIDLLSRFKTTSEPVVSVTVTPTPAEKLITTSYRGTLPCADCPGLDTELILKKNSTDSIDGVYVMKETYLERNVDPLISEGTWKTIFSSSKGKPVVIYEINQGTPDSVRYFLQVNDNEIKMLDKNKDEIVGLDLNLSLKKIAN